MGMKGKESICRIKGTPGLDNEALEVNMRAMLRAQPYISKSFSFHACPPLKAEIQECKQDSSGMPQGRPTAWLTSPPHCSEGQNDAAQLLSRHLLKLSSIINILGDHNYYQFTNVGEGCPTTNSGMPPVFQILLEMNQNQKRVYCLCK